MKYYRDAKYVIAMRGHGQIVPVGFGTPVITFSTHAKIKGMMDSLGLSRFHVEMDDNFASKMAEAIEDLENNYSETRKEIAEINVRLVSETATQLAEVKNRISN